MKQNFMIIGGTMGWSLIILGFYSLFMVSIIAFLFSVACMLLGVCLIYFSRIVNIMNNQKNILLSGRVPEITVRSITVVLKISQFSLLLCFCVGVINYWIMFSVEVLSYIYYFGYAFVLIHGAVRLYVRLKISRLLLI